MSHTAVIAKTMLGVSMTTKSQWQENTFMFQDGGRVSGKEESNPRSYWRGNWERTVDKMTNGNHSVSKTTDCVMSTTPSGWTKHA